MIVEAAPAPLPSAPARRARLQVRHPTALIAVGAGLLGAAVSGWGIGIPSAWRDEQATAVAAERSLGDLVTMAGNIDAVHALYYALMHLWLQLVPVDVFWMRLPSALAVGASAAGLVVLGRALDRRATGVIAAAVFLALPEVLWSATEARSYALQGAAVVWLTMLLLVALRRRRWWIWLLYGLAGALTVSLFLYLAFVLAAHLLSVAARSDRRRTLPPLLLALTGAALLSAPLAVVAITQSGQLNWVSPLGPGTAPTVFQYQWFRDSLPIAIVAWLLIVWGVIRFGMSRSPETRSRLVLLLGWLLLPSMALLLLSLWVLPTYVGRYAAASLPAVALLIGAGLARVPRPVAVVALLAIAALVTPSYLAQREPLAKGTDWGLAAAEVARLSHPGDAVYFGDTGANPDPPRNMLALYPADFTGLRDVGLLRTAAQAGALHDEVVPLSTAVARVTGREPIVVALKRDDPSRAAVQSALAAAGFRQLEQWKGPRTVVERWQRTP